MINKKKEFDKISIWGKAWRKFKRHKLAMLSLFVFSILIIMAIFAPLLCRYHPNQINLRKAFLPPSRDHWLGTDGVGRDVWARLLYGGRVSIAVGVGSTLISLCVALFLGILAGYYGKWIDLLTMRLVDAVLSVPPIVLMMALAALLGPSLSNAILVIGFLGWPGMARLVRAQVLSIREQDFVIAARAIGVPVWSLLIKHVFPNVVSPIIVASTLQIASAILTEAALSFLGIGVPPPTASWGNMLQEAQSLTILAHRPWLWVPPGIAIIICVLCVNFLGDGLRDALDPRSID